MKLAELKKTLKADKPAESNNNHDHNIWTRPESLTDPYWGSRPSRINPATRDYSGADPGRPGAVSAIFTQSVGGRKRTPPAEGTKGGEAGAAEAPKLVSEAKRVLDVAFMKEVLSRTTVPTPVHTAGEVLNTDFNAPHLFIVTPAGDVIKHYARRDYSEAD